MQIPQTLCTRDAVDRGSASHSIQAQQIWNYANEEWDLYQPFIQDNVHARCESTLRGPLFQFSL